MAERRMISKKIIHSDAFLDLPSSTQNLYFHLLLEADDEGFVNSPKRIQRTVGATDVDAQLLFQKKFLLGFESGVIVIKHWRIHNYIQNDRFKKTAHTEERKMLDVKDNLAYTLSTSKENVSTSYPTCTPSIGKVKEIYIPAKMQGDDAVLSEKFSLIWKEYSISFLKAKFGRRGGSKDKAKKMFLALVAKGYSIKQIADLIIAEHSLNFPRDLERVLRLDSMKQFIEDKEASND